MADILQSAIDIKAVSAAPSTPPAVSVPTLYLVKGSGGIPDAPSDGKTYGRKDAAWSEVTSGGGIPQETPSGTTLLPNIDYVKIPTANVTYTLAEPTPGIVNHYHLTWLNYLEADAFVPTFPVEPIIQWAEACGAPPASVDGGAWLEYSIMYVREGSDYAYIGIWTKIT